MDKCYGLARDAKLLSKRDFDRVFKKARRHGNRIFTVLSRQNDLDRARLGLVVSKRVDKRAVGRNIIKRVIRESFRHHQATLSGQDFIVIPKFAARSASKHELRQAIDHVWRRIGEQAGKNSK